MLNRYIAPQAVTAAAAALYVTDRAGVGKARGHGTLTLNGQPYASLVCRLMVSVSTLPLVIHVITWITTHLSAPKGWKAEFAWLVDPHRTLYVVKVPLNSN